MTLSIWDMVLYSGALLILFLTPGPVWLAMVARGVSGGFASAWPLAFGVAVGDVVWPFLAVVGMAWLVSEYGAILVVLRWVASAVFLFMGWMAIRHANSEIQTNGRLTRPGRWAGFLAGVMVILGNPKAILFYMGVLPGFFDLGAVTRPDIVAIVVLSVAVPLIGNLGFALVIDRMRRILGTPRAIRRMNLGAGGLLIAVALILPFT
ncbi:LysE family translocator [Pseudodonghicola xiamenensis]|uniref:Threonine transporter RhtB n=1 Tax=Pseudodonghicola xiamenensis TaxID=337702 RepID=A0A8J3H5L5_9RHOB|nr:LysE family translocator [Pseudodonghicola xiamenensis]GHG82332.1 threonine transporter RhtB [Pseudodonghicola xiamenensis]